LIVELQALRERACFAQKQQSPPLQVDLRAGACSLAPIRCATTVSFETRLLLINVKEGTKLGEPGKTVKL
jgi:hypothetical protein